MQDILNNVYLGNTVLQFLQVLGFLLCSIVVIGVLRKKFLKRLKSFVKRTNNTIDDFLVRLVKRGLVPFLYIVVLYLSAKMLVLPLLANRCIDVFLIAAVTVIAARCFNEFIAYCFAAYRQKSGMGDVMEKSFGGILTVVQTIVWGLAVILFLDNIGIKISTVIAGLGIGGVAVALAAQTVLKDLFSYVCILFDRPFSVGDFIIVGDYLGTVEYIGIKTTRIASLGGEQLIFSNADLTDSRVRNYKRMQKRRVVFNFGVIYQTSAQHLKEIPELVKQIVASIDEAVFDRAHFAKYGDSSLDFEVVYYVLSGDYNKYMDIQQKINLDIFEQFAVKGIEFAYPTRTLYINKD